MKYYPTAKALKLGKVIKNFWDALNAIPGNSVDIYTDQLTKDASVRASESISNNTFDDGSVDIYEIYPDKDRCIKMGLLTTEKLTQTTYRFCSSKATDIYCSFKHCDAWAEPQEDGSLPNPWIKVIGGGGHWDRHLCSFKHANYFFRDPVKYDVDADEIGDLLDKDGNEIK